MTIVDYVVILIVAFSAIISLVRGFVREVLSLMSWAGAIFVAKESAPLLIDKVPSVISHVGVRYVLAFAAVFVTTVFILSFISRQISRLVGFAGLAATDRSLGMIFGMARGVILVSFVALIVGVTPLVTKEYWINAYFRQELEVASKILNLIPDDIKKEEFEVQ